jgi:uncharacterized membrane protein YedE/YeeE
LIDFISRPWPWYVAGPLIGLFVPALLLVGNRLFGISGNFRHMCAAVLPGRNEFLRYDWKKSGLWNLTFLAGIVLGGWLATHVIGSPDAVVGIAESTRADLAALGIRDFAGLVPSDLFSWSQAFTPAGLVVLGLGGFLVGFGARWAGGCTSGHAISGLADLQLPSLVAVVGFFVGGLLVTWFVLPLVLPGV